MLKYLYVVVFAISVIGMWLAARADRSHHSR